MSTNSKKTSEKPAKSRKGRVHRPAWLATVLAEAAKTEPASTPSADDPLVLLHELESMIGKLNAYEEPPSRVAIRLFPAGEIQVRKIA